MEQSAFPFVQPVDNAPKPGEVWRQFRRGKVRQVRVVEVVGDVCHVETDYHGAVFPRRLWVAVRRMVKSEGWERVFP